MAEDSGEMPRTAIGAGKRAAGRRRTAIVAGAAACAIATAGVLVAPALLRQPLPGARSFVISGGPATLSPGRAAPLDLTLSNPNAFPVRLTSLTVAVAPRTSLPGCSGARGFRTSALVGSVDLPPRSRTTLSSLGVGVHRLPTVMPLAPGGGRGDCSRARITLRYAGTAAPAR